MRSNASYLITPDAFSVHPSLVGRPLARPARRLAAMLLVFERLSRGGRRFHATTAREAPLRPVRPIRCT